MERQVFVDAALAVADFGANPNKGNLPDFLDLIAPGESEAKAKSMAQMSCCGLVVAGIWRAAGVIDSHIEPPYIIGSAISRLTVLAHHVDAWINFTVGAYPNPGDMVLVGDNGAGGVEHVFTIVSSDGAGGFESVDGGQRDSAQYQTILKKKRIWSGQKDKAYMGSDPGSALAGRKIYGWVDCEKLPG